jgi:hypothetical protein
MDPMYPLRDPVDTSGDEECTAAPSSIPHRVIPTEVTQALFDVGHGTAYDRIYARGVPDTPRWTRHPSIRCNALSSSRRSGSAETWDARIRSWKRGKRPPLVDTLRHYMSKINVVAFPIGYVGNTRITTHDSLLAAFSADRTRSEQAGDTRIKTSPNTTAHARHQDFPIVKSLLDALSDLAQSSLLKSIKNRMHLVVDLVGAVSRSRAHSGASPAHSSATH